MATAEIQLEKPSKGVYKSEVWNYFGFPIHFENGVKKVDHSKTVCMTCKSELRYHGNTTNMSLHIKRHHPTFSISTDRKRKVDENDMSSSSINSPKQVCQVPGQLRLAEAFKTKLSHTSLRAQMISRQISKFICKDMRPLSMISNDGFKQLINLLEPKYVIPSRPHFTDRIIPDLYNETNDQV